MCTLASLPREVLRWLLSLDLSFPVKHIKRDFSNGFLFAEILCRYYPADIQMHSFENVTSIERKKANWVVLERLFRRRGIPINQQQIDAIINADDDAASDVLQSIYSFITSDSYRESLECPSSSSQPPCAPGSPLHSRHPSVGRSKSSGTGMEVREASVSGGYPYGADGALYPAAYAAPDQQQLMQHAMWQQLLVQQQQQQAGHMQSVGPGVLQQQMQQMYAQVMGGMAPGGQLDDLAFSRKPRPVEYTPYKMSDYEAANFDVKKAKSYWQLGRLGPEESQELQAKREARERVRALSQRIKAANNERLAAAPPARAKPKDPSARQRAVEYAKTSVPKPELLRQRSSVKQRSSSPPAASPAAGPGGAGDERQGKQQGGGSSSSHLEQLEQQHERFSQQVERIRAELATCFGN